MTKPVTSVAAMMLVEEGELDLTAPAAEYLPVFKDKPVGVEDIDPVTGKHTLLLEPEKRPMQVIDLLHTSGLVYPEEGKTALHRRGAVGHTHNGDCRSTIRGGGNRSQTWHRCRQREWARRPELRRRCA
jgi:CubicO group peptidase (beta-lactamase class C family)